MGTLKVLLCIIAINNYSLKWRWLVMDIYQAAQQRGKYPLLATDTEVNSCFSIYQNSEIIHTTKN